MNVGDNNGGTCVDGDGVSNGDRGNHGGGDPAGSGCSGGLGNTDGGGGVNIFSGGSEDGDACDCVMTNSKDSGGGDEIGDDGNEDW